MIRLLLLAAAWMLAGGQATPPVPSQAPPDTDIFLASLSIAGGAVGVGPPVNVTAHAGYDNQPSFTPDGRAILFASDRDADPSAPALRRTDIYKYDIDSKRITRLTTTPEGEFSPTITPDGRHISAIRVETDGTQRLWQFTLDGKKPELVFPEIKPVGYHAWADERRVVLYVLGDPPTLQLADVLSGHGSVIARGVGRSIQRIPGFRTMSFVERRIASDADGAPRLVIRELDPETTQMATLVEAVKGATEADVAWMPDRTLLMAYDGALYAWQKGDAGWKKAVDLTALGLKGVTRIAVSPKGDRLALVAQ